MGGWKQWTFDGTKNETDTEQDRQRLQTLESRSKRLATLVLDDSGCFGGAAAAMPSLESLRLLRTVLSLESSAGADVIVRDDDVNVL